MNVDPLFFTTTLDSKLKQDGSRGGGEHGGLQHRFVKPLHNKPGQLEKAVRTINDNELVQFK
jgi:hypothetical protein